jgi:phage baseplate assembly protein W
MYDLFHEWGNDLAVGSGGDLAVSTGSDTVSQRVCRRLLTNPGDYLWNLDYGGGLAQFVGTPANGADIEAVVRTQLALETAVPATPEPQVSVRVVDAANGYVVASITYADPSSMAPVQLNLSTG